MVEPIFDYQFRLILIGDSTVGKSSLLKYTDMLIVVEVVTRRKCLVRQAVWV
jgi:DNA replicative helicase MCM subunit Mcm2 (Cdc46/Mcm family)